MNLYIVLNYMVSGPGVVVLQGRRMMTEKVTVETKDEYPAVPNQQRSQPGGLPRDEAGDS